MFNFLRHCQMVFQSDGTVLLRHQKQLRVPVPPHPNAGIISLFYFTSSKWCVWWYLMVVLICISLTTNDLEYLFLFLFAIQVSSLLNYLFKTF